MAEAGRPEERVGELIRDVLREEQPCSISVVRIAVNKIRHEQGLRGITYPTMRRYFKQAVKIGILEVVDKQDRKGPHRDDLDKKSSELKTVEGGVLENAAMRNIYRIVRGYTMDKRWRYLPLIVAGKRI